MKVEMWSDIGCPFCYIGKHHFAKALEQFAHKDHVEVEYRSFQLDPNAAREPAGDLYDMLSAKFGRSRDEVKSMNEQVARQGRAAGLEFRFDDVIPANSLDAHRLIKFAEQHGKEERVVERLFEAYFVNGEHIGRTGTLVEIGVECGLDREAIVNMLQSDKFKDEVQSDSREAGQLGANGVPFYVINRRFAVSGAQPSDIFLEALNKAWAEAGK